jgi:hypothetical protein
MNFKLAIAAAAVASTFALLPGCAVDAPQDEADIEEAGTSEDELSANAQKLVGAYHGTRQGVPPTFQGLVFSFDGTFFGDVDTGIRCITAPCPSSVHLEGRYSATKNYLRLSPKSGKAEGFYGRYRYSFVGSKLTISSTAYAPGWTNTLTKELSYCAQPSDCGAQGLIHPMCVGSWTCGVSKASSCGYQCGVFPPPPPPGTAIWPVTATKLVAESAGGGFTPPPPAGSTCAIGRQKYTLDRATRLLSWETCDWTGDGSPLHLKTGSTTITAAELATVNQAMNAVTIATEDMCGADKPLYQIKVTTPAGEKTYTDSFYRCQGGSRTYVDGIDGVFGALRAAAE